MDTNNVYKLAVQAQLAAAMRELLRLELEEDKSVQGLSFLVYSTDGVISVLVHSEGCSEGYSL